MFDDFTGGADDVQEEKTQEQNAFDAYINKEDPNFKWVDTGVSFTSLFLGKVYMLNVTSQ